MFFLVLLIYLEGLHANVKDDVGDIPYENLMSSIISPRTSGSTNQDYGNIPYEKVSPKNEDYGNVPYEEGALKPRVDVDYGNIPYEKVGGSTPSVKNASMDIAGIIQDLFKGRVTLTTKAEEINVTVTSTSTELVTTSSTTGITTVSPKPRADAKDDADFIDYKSPGTIDDSDCNPAKEKCSTCRDAQGYRRYCLDGTTTAAPTDLTMVLNILVNIADVYWSYGDLLHFSNFNNSMFRGYEHGWPVCPTTTSTTETPSPTWPPHNLTGRLIAKCFVCGMYEGGIPQEDHVCSDSFLSHAYRKHCKFLNRDGWHINGSGEFYMWGRWSGGCSLRFTDITTVYHQRTCRSALEPAMGGHYVSRRMAKMEYALKKEKDACLSSPTASLVPLSRGISLYSRFHVCVCSANYCNRAERLSAVSQWHLVVFTLSIRFYDVLLNNIFF